MPLGCSPETPMAGRCTVSSCGCPGDRAPTRLPLSRPGCLGCSPQDLDTLSLAALGPPSGLLPRTASAGAGVGLRPVSGTRRQGPQDQHPAQDENAGPRPNQTEIRIPRGKGTALTKPGPFLAQRPVSRKPGPSMCQILSDVSSAFERPQRADLQFKKLQISGSHKQPSLPEYLLKGTMKKGL